MFKKNESKKSKILLKTSVGTFRILKKIRKNQAPSFYFKKLNKLYYGAVYKQEHVRNPYSFTDQEQ